MQEEELPDSPFGENISFEQLQALYEQAEATFLTADQPQSLPLFTRIIDTLEPAARLGGLNQDATGLLVGSLAHRAVASFNFGEAAHAEGDLRQVIALDPNYELDRSRVSPKFLDLFDGLKDEHVGYLEFVVNPPEARVTVDGQVVDPYAGPVAALIGPRSVRGERIGYAATEQEVEVEGGRTQQVPLTLERTSPVLVLRTRPPGVTLLVNGEVRGLTVEETDPDSLSRRGLDPSARGPTSGELLIGDLDLGSHQVEARKDGFRTFVGAIETLEARDYPIRPIVLEPAVGTVLLHGLPAQAVVLANGSPVTPQRRADATPRLVLAPGRYDLSISEGTVGVFEAQISVVDAKNTDVQVNLRPAVAFLGVLGGDEVGARKLLYSLKTELSKLRRWTLVDRSGGGPELVLPLGIEALALRRLAEEDQTPAEPLDWSRVQQLVDEKAPGAVYLLAVLSDDLLAQSSDLWIWPAAPGPSRPERKRIRLEDPAALAQFIASFSVSIGQGRSSVGMLLIDSDASTAPVVVHVTPAGPAEAAGLKLGEEISAMGGTPVFTVAQVEEQLAGLQPGSTISLEVQGPGGNRSVELRLGSSPRTVDLANPNLVYSAISAEIAVALKRGDTPTPRWVLELNQAAVLLHGGAYRKAVRVLRGIDAPSGPGLGKATVDYWLGMALAQAGSNYMDAARIALSRAAAATDGRLFHNDGPWLAPRARARLTTLGGSSE